MTVVPSTPWGQDTVIVFPVFFRGFVFVVSEFVASWKQFELWFTDGYPQFVADGALQGLSDDEFW